MGWLRPRPVPPSRFLPLPGRRRYLDAVARAQELAVQGAGEYCGPDGNCGVLLFARHYAPEDGHHRLYKSYDYGATWQCLEDPALPWNPAPAEIPEPATWLLLSGGGAGLAEYLRSRHRRRVRHLTAVAKS